MNLMDAILELCDALDPDHQGVHWPDPIGWDGRPLVQQATDLLALTWDRKDDARVQAAADRVVSALDALNREWYERTYPRHDGDDHPDR